MSIRTTIRGYVTDTARAFDKAPVECAMSVCVAGPGRVPRSGGAAVGPCGRAVRVSAPEAAPTVRRDADALRISLVLNDEPLAGIRPNAETIWRSSV